MASKDNNDAPQADDKKADRQIKVNAQYIKDLSFENPKAPGSLVPGKEQPQIDVSLDLKGNALPDNLSELELHIGIKAKAGDETLFVLELAYAGVFTLENIPDEEKEPALFVFCPTLLFPFARRIISDTTRDGGFPPLMLEPIDFGRLYAQRIQENQTKQ